MTVIEVQGLHKEYPTTIAVDDISFSVEEDEIFGIVGPNGAGKTTTVECIAGLRRPDAGRISVLGLDPLQTHYMDEAQQPCDRVALIDSGRVAALDTPAGLAAHTPGRPSASRSARQDRSTTGC